MWPNSSTINEVTILMVHVMCTCTCTCTHGLQSVSTIKQLIAPSFTLHLSFCTIRIELESELHGEELKSTKSTTSLHRYSSILQENVS